MPQRGYLQARGWAQHCPGRAETIASALGDFVLNRSPRGYYSRWERVRALPSPLPLPGQVWGGLSCLPCPMHCGAG